ncbi:MAG: hypothetical protein RIG62_25165 [Cyclobacteriaceae bacterium]
MKKLPQLVFFIGWLGMLMGCLSEPETPVTADSPFLAPVPLGLVIDERLEEVSGLVASRKNPGMLWVHNDSGNPAELYLLDSQAVVRAVYVLGTEQRDWEDIAIGPGPVEGETYLYVGDIGDNFAIHSTNYIYRFPEPAWAGSTLADSATVAIRPDTIPHIDTLAFTYPDEQWDAETLLLDPLTRDLYVLSKAMSSMHVYRLPYPQQTDTVAVAQLLAALPFEGANLLDRLVAGDIAADGQALLLKTYEQIFYRTRTDSTGSLNDWLKQPADTLPYPAEPQGEAVGFAVDGSGYYTLSESRIGTDLYLYFYPRQSVDTQ